MVVPLVGVVIPPFQYSTIPLFHSTIPFHRIKTPHPASFNQWFNQLAKETRYSRGSFARNSSRQKTPTTESPPSEKQSRTTSNPERCSFVAFEPPKVSLPVHLHFLPHASNAPSFVSRLTLRLSMSVDNRTSNQTSALKRKKCF